MDISKLHERISLLWNEKTLPALETFVSRKALSPGFDPDWEKNGILDQVCREAAAFGSSLFPNGVFEVLREAGRSPCLFFSVPATGVYAGKEDTNVFFYGHLDKQPPASGWSEGLGPWNPVRRNGRLYGRGCADDGYSVYSALTVIRALEDEGADHPRAVGLIETCEETGSNDLEHFLTAIRSRCGEPALVCVLDSGAGNYEQFWLTSSLRGSCKADVTVQVLKNGMHSGTASGVVPSSFDVMRVLLDRLQDPMTGELRDPAFNVEIPANRVEDMKKTAEVVGSRFFENFPWAERADGTKVNSRCKTAYDALAAQCWKPTMSVTGAEGIPCLANAGNALRASTTLRLSFRLPPTANPEGILPVLEKNLLEDVPFNAAVTIGGGEAFAGWNAPEESEWFRTACDSGSLAMWGKPAMRLGEGGSIPILGLFERNFTRAQFAVTGVLGPGANAHGPDESLHLDYAERFMSCIGLLVASVPA